MAEFAYAYLVGTCIFGIAWLPLFIYRKDLRREMLVMGTIIGLLAPLWAPWFLVDYWSPAYALWFGIEDFLYGFFTGGIISVIYEEFYAKRFSVRKLSNRNHILHIALIALATALAFHIGVITGINSIYAAILSFIALFIGIAWYRSDLIVDGLVSGALFASVTFLFSLVYAALYPGIIEAWWHLGNLSGVLVEGTPLEELLWAFCMGMAGGPLYEFVSRRRIVRRSDR
jgi:hypothetical protein